MAEEATRDTVLLQEYAKERVELRITAAPASRAGSVAA